MVVDNFQEKSEQIKSSGLFRVFFVKHRIIAFLIFLSFSGVSCSYAVSAVRYLTQETYISGKDVKERLIAAAFAGFGVYRASHPTDVRIEEPVVAIASARVDENNKYLETQVESCEEILFVSNATGMDVTNQVMAGLLCNLGPGKKPSEL